jgi:hypothetical protein
MNTSSIATSISLLDPTILLNFEKLSRRVIDRLPLVPASSPDSALIPQSSIFPANRAESLARLSPDALVNQFTVRRRTLRLADDLFLPRNGRLSIQMFVIKINDQTMQNAKKIPETTENAKKNRRNRRTEK